jgi:cytochrome c oxidase subunit 1
MSVPAASRSGWRKLIGFNMLTGILLGIVGWYLGHFIGGRFTGANLAYYGTEAGENDIAIFLGYFLGVVGFLVGLGFANYPLKRLLGHPATLAENESEAGGLIRYFTLNTDHKVVAKQYMVGIGVFFFVAGLNAMLIRTELLQPNVHVFGANQYLTLVGMHGSMMMGTMTSGLLGPLATFLVPVMIGSRRMAFSRLSALTFWLLMAGEVILLTTIFFGGFQTGWTGYQPLGAQGTAGYDAYIGFFALVGLSMCLFGFNLIATITVMRGRGMTWSRLPIFVWGAYTTAWLMLLAAPMLIAALLMGTSDRTLQTAFYIPGQGGSAYLFQNLFWVFGHPEVYILGLPARRRGDARHRVLELVRVAAPPVRIGDQRRPAAVLHALDGGDLASNGVHLPVRHGDAVARANTVLGADAVLPGLDLQLPLGRDLGCVQLRRPQ